MDRTVSPLSSLHDPTAMIDPAIIGIADLDGTELDVPEPLSVIVDSMEALGISTAAEVPLSEAISLPTSIPAGIDKDNNVGKLFVGGLSWETTKDGLSAYFGEFGEVTECVIMTDPHTGRSRGFGFVSFADPAIAAIVINSGPHNLDNRKIDPKPAVPRGTASKNTHPAAQHHAQAKHDAQSRDQYKTKKIFVGGLNPETTQESLTAFFEDYGVVENVVLMYDRETKRPRGFGFVTFATEEPVLKLCSMHFIELNGKTVEIKIAQPKTGGDGRRGNRTFNRGLPGHSGFNGQPGFQNGGGYHPGYNQGYSFAGYNTGAQMRHFGNFQDMNYQQGPGGPQGFMPMQFYPQQTQEFDGSQQSHQQQQQQQHQHQQMQHPQQQRVEFSHTGSKPSSATTPMYQQQQQPPSVSGTFANYGGYHPRGFAGVQMPQTGMPGLQGFPSTTGVSTSTSQNGTDTLNLAGFLPDDTEDSSPF